MRWRARRLQHQLFLWLGMTSLATVLAAGLALRSLEPSWPRRYQQLSAFAAAQFAERWTDVAARRVLAEQVAEAFEARLLLSDAQGRQLERVGPSAGAPGLSGDCHGPQQSLQVTRSGAPLGSVNVCLLGGRGFGRSLLAVLGSACLVLWASAALVARRLVRPLSLLIATTREIGSGNLGARVRLGRHQRGELALLAESVNDMAQRIERQMRDQRELLAAVSHEVRSPLARLRVASELLRGNPEAGASPGGPPNVAVLDALEREVQELDVLVGKLLASSRLDFETLSRKPLAAGQLFADVLARRRLSLDLLRDETGGKLASLDATLIARALDNVLDNAEHHGGGVRSCLVHLAPAAGEVAPAVATHPGVPPLGRERLVFEVCDGGSGFAPQVQPRAFEAFYRSAEQGGSRHGSLGLGLALVQRIAHAHGGQAWAENLPGGGARVAFSVAL